ncbi:hypothetical protein QFZ91_000649 [Paraburkholderia sp. JPY419]
MSISRERYELASVSGNRCAVRGGLPPVSRSHRVAIAGTLCSRSGQVACPAANRSMPFGVSRPIISRSIFRADAWVSFHTALLRRTGKDWRYGPSPRRSVVWMRTYHSIVFFAAGSHSVPSNIDRIIDLLFPNRVRRTSPSAPAWSCQRPMQPRSYISPSGFRHCLRNSVENIVGNRKSDFHRCWPIMPSEMAGLVVRISFGVKRRACACWPLFRRAIPIGPSSSSIAAFSPD